MINQYLSWNPHRKRKRRGIETRGAVTCMHMGRRFAQNRDARRKLIGDMPQVTMR
ncbi:hypothetical protein DPMN_110910 [Dreissena polymorpha]|uniref:Uncharacterized protein n=1 Tax=Dreissena polymorpha TaxID=45954 RepID=A0A9D4KDI8_DREPO|nr:hypothetical protein DPMN_110910 [Dreissena polymorpha]